MLIFIKKIKGQLFLFIIILLSIIIIITMLFLNDMVYNVRLLELKAFLQEINRMNSNVDYLFLVAKYKLHKELYENKIKYLDLDKEELKVAVLLSNFQKQNELVLHKYDKTSAPIFYVLNFLRFFFNKPPLHQIINNPVDEELVIAYYFERNNNYKNALKLYDGLVNKYKLTIDKKLIVILHEGFCNAIIGEYAKAKDKYLYIIKNYNNEEIAITAAILLRYLENFQGEIEKIKKSNMPDIDKSENLYKIIAFKDAIEILDNVQSNNQNELEKVNYLKARCLEETDQKEESIKTYQKIIDENHKSEYAKYSNQRLLIISSIDMDGSTLKKLSIENNKLINDPSFNEILEYSNKLEDDGINEIIYNKKNDYSDEINNLFSKSDMNDFIETSIKTIENKKAVDSKETNKTVDIKDGRKNKINITVPKKSKAKSNLIEKKIYENKNKKGPYIIEYRDLNDVIYRIESYNENDKLLNFFIYEYDEDGRIIRVIGYNGDGKPLKD